MLLFVLFCKWGIGSFERLSDYVLKWGYVLRVLGLGKDMIY